MVRKMMLTAAVAMLVLPAMASAQAITASATVAPTSAMTGSGDIAFGTLSTTVPNVIDAADGTIVRTVTFNHDIAVTFSSVTALTSAGLNPLPVVLRCAAQEGGTWTTPVVCGSGPIDLTVGAGQTTALLGFGGEIDEADVAAAAAGSYTATLTVTLTAR